MTILTFPHVLKIKAAVFTLADQIIHSGTTFLTGVFVGRMLSVGDFGEFSLGLTLVVFSLTLQDNLLATPYTYHFHNSKPDSHAAMRAGGLIQSQLLAVLCSVLLLSITGINVFLFHQPHLSVFMTLGLILPFLFGREYLRRLFFTEFRMSQALIMDTGVSLLQFGLLFFAWFSDVLRPDTAFLAMAASAGLVLLSCLWFFRKEFDFAGADIKTDTLRNIHFGRWLILGSFCHLGSLYAYPWCIFWLYGREEVGAFSACLTLINLLNPLILGFNNYFRPKLIQTHAEQGGEAMHSLIQRACLSFLPLAGLIVLFLAFAGGDLVRLVYGEGFSGLGPIVAVLALSLFSVLLSMPLQLGILALNKPQINPAFHAVTLTFTILAGFPLIVLYGKIGAAAGYSISTILGLIALGWLYHREIRRLREKGAETKPSAT